MIKYQGKTIVGLAHERGANRHIKKQSTAWQYLLEESSLKAGKYLGFCKGTTPYPDLGKIGYWRYGAERDAVAAAHYRKIQWESRIKRNDTALCHAHGYLLRNESPGELMPGHIKYRDMMLEKIEQMLKHTYALATLPRNPQEWNDPDFTLCIAGRTIILHRSDSASWDNSSSHYPSSTSITRTAYLMREGWEDLSKDGLIRNARYADNILHTWSDGDGMVERTINYEARGHWQQKIIIELFGVTPERQRGLSHIQLDPHYRIKRIRKIAGIEIWQRTLAGEIIDYCAVRGKDTYHAATPREAVKGLAAKLATPGSRREILDMAYALSLGFCHTGVEQFCEDYGIDSAGAYPRAEIQAMVARGNGKADKYERELAKAGIEI